MSRFEDAFPGMDDVIIEVTQTGHMVPKSLREPQVFRKSNWPWEYMDCNNPRCLGGRHSVRVIVREMARGRLIDVTDTRTCGGREVGQRVHPRGGGCMNVFSFNVSIAYESA